SASIVSPEAVEEYGADFSNNAVGTGPYKLKEWEPGVEVVLEKNEDYFKDVPSIDKITFKPISESQSRVADLESGKLDFIVNVPPDDLNRLEDDSNLQVIEQPSM